MFIERLAVHGISDQNFSGMKTRIDFSERENSFVSVRTCSDNVVCKRLSTELAAQRSIQLAEKIGQPHSRICLIGIRVRIVQRNRNMCKPFQLG